MKKLIIVAITCCLFIVLIQQRINGQSVCPYQAKYLNSVPGCNTPGGFYLLSNSPIPSGAITLNFPGSPNPGCTQAFTPNGSGLCNPSNTYYAYDNAAPICAGFFSLGTVTFADGTVCTYEGGILNTVNDCNDLIENCSEPLIEFAKDFVKTDPNCKLWEGPCSTESEIWRTGNVYIGTTNIPQGGQKLVVKGGITTEMLQICKAEWCDYVFSDTFNLMSLEKVNHYIQEKGHLPDCTPAATITKEGGFQLEEETVSQQKKIEEIFLHLIHAQQRLDNLDKKIPGLDLVVESNSLASNQSILSEYPEKEKTADFNLLQIQCLVIKSAPNGTAGIIPSPDSGPYTVSWSGASSGTLMHVVCNGTIKIPNLPTGNYSVTVTNGMGMSATCNFFLPNNGTPSDCSLFSDPNCKGALIDMLEEEAFTTPSNCKQWEGDPCSHEAEIYRLGNVEIGTQVGRAGYSLAVKGGILTDGFRVELCESTGWCDYVFDEDYPLPSLYTVDSFIKTNKHLPGSVPQSEVTEAGGFEMRSVKTDHQEKIEEAYLYLIAMDKKKKELQQRLTILSEQK